jgi:uncharacterized protein YndB with AHSA1/START domain
MTIRRRLLLLATALSFAGAASAQDSITSEGTIAAPVAEVWAAFTTGAGLRSWMAPHADIELRVDGLMRANYKPEGTLGDGSTIVNRVLSFEPQRMLSLRVAKAPDDFPFPGAIMAMWSVVYFEDAGDSRTRLRVVSMGFTPDAESQKMKAFFERGNAYTVKKLQEKFAK